MRRIVIVVVLIGAVGLILWNCRSTDAPAPAAPAGSIDAGWEILDAQARCENARALVSYHPEWPTECRWRRPGEGLQGQAFPPPKGAPPYDDPHVEIYVIPEQTRDQVANAIAHEWGHMHHTREPGFVTDYLAARNLPAQTPSEVWTEDYAEVFATLFSPPAPRWRAPTSRPSPEALVALRDQFFG